MEEEKIEIAPDASSPTNGMASTARIERAEPNPGTLSRDTATRTKMDEGFYPTGKSL